jgi:hypothetical protein
VAAKQVSLDQLKQTAQNCLAAQQQKGLSLLTYLVKAQKEVLEFEVGILEDVLRLLKKGIAVPPET